MRYLVECAKQGRVVMSVDSTDLLNRRHLVDADKDEFFLRAYPPASEDAEKGEGYDFDQVYIYEHAGVSQQAQHKHVVMVTYGNGVPTAVLAGRKLQESGQAQSFTVVDVPCLSKTPAQLISYFESLVLRNKVQDNAVETTVIFADVCKKNAGMPLSLRAVDLHDQGLLSASKWTVIGAENTYNPLGTYLTFLSVDDIVGAVDRVHKKE
jgi:hypothetical protein